MDYFQPSDLFQYKTIDELNCVSTSDIAACTVSSINPDQDNRTMAIWAVPADGSPAWKLTTGSSHENTPRWSPDGSKLAFLSDRNGMLQIYVLSMQGGEPTQVGNLPSAVQTIEWSPDGKQLLAICNMTVDAELRGKRPGNEASNKQNDAPKLAWRLPYKLDGSGYMLASEKHLFVVDAVSGKHTQLTDGAFNVKSASWSPDSSKIAYTRTREGRIAHNTDVWVMDASGEQVHQASHEVAITQYPKWSNDGSKLIFSGSTPDGDAQIRLWLYDTQTKITSGLGSDDIEVVSGDSVKWADDDASVTFVLAHRGRQLIASLSIVDGTIQHLVYGDRQIQTMAVSSNSLFFISEDALNPNEIHCTSLNGDNETRLTSFNAWWADKVLPNVVIKSFTVPDEDGGQETIEGWLLTPPNHPGPFPLLVDVHGGPASYAFTRYTWHSYWYVLLAQGWAVIALNPVGSSSFGREFSDRLRGRWGEIDFNQHLAAIDALKQEGIADNRIAITGKSYGGFMAAWAIGHSEVFRVAVVSAPVINLEAHYAVSDSGYYSDPYAMDGEAYVDQEKFQTLSPMRHIRNASTPTLILQGEDDERCPKNQAEAFFTRLLCNTQAAAELVLYPGASHHFFETGKPSHCIDVVNRMVSWVNNWINVER